jgi:hypothetical protein
MSKGSYQGDYFESVVSDFSTTASEPTDAKLAI